MSEWVTGPLVSLGALYSRGPGAVLAGVQVAGKEIYKGESKADNDLTKP